MDVIKGGDRVPGAEAVLHRLVDQGLDADEPMIMQMAADVIIAEPARGQKRTDSTAPAAIDHDLGPDRLPLR